MPFGSSLAGRRIQSADSDPGGSRSDHFELERRDVGKVDDATLSEGASIDDLYDDSVTVFEIHHFDVGGEGERRVGGGHLIHVVGRAA